MVKFTEFSRLCVSFLLGALCALPAASQAENPAAVGEDRFKVSLGYFLPALNTDLRADSSTLGPGTNFDLEADLGVEDDQDLARIDGYVRLGERHRIGLGYFTLDRGGSRVLTRDIQFGDVTFTTGTGVSASIETDITIANYMYSFFQRPNQELALALGVHYLDAETRLATTGGAVTETASAAGPLPLIGLDYVYAPTPRVHLGLLGQWFSADVDTYDGSIINARATAEYFVHKNIALGIGYNYFRVNVDTDDSDFKGSLDWDYNGLQVFATLRF
ncbi:MAG TPA: hypothetical protein VLB10_06245 [Gammaproteobacteria bacterium]|jgi:opacity protein-like surface antigen|nr:hypothetical protein [Gammaproteobacteria bacterium]